MGKKKYPIPIRNLFYMLCYAWNVLSIMDDIKVGDDEYDDAYNLLARVFSYGIGKLIRSGFHRAYVEQTDELSTLKGKVSIQASIDGMTMRKKKLVCLFDEYSPNDIFNQILKYTMESLLKNPAISASTKRDIRKQIIFFDGINSKAPTKENRQKLVFNRNNATYKLLINTAIMLYYGTVVNEDASQTTFKDFFREEQMHRVFELFILNFYDMHLDRSVYKVHSTKISWQIEEDAFDVWGDMFEVKVNPGDRRTDIVIENKKSKLQMIFDAKYYKQTFVNAYMGDGEKSIRTGHLNQLRGYILDSDFEGKKIGALLYPMVNSDLKKGMVFPIQDSPIIVKTINLDEDWREIENDLLGFMHKIESVNLK